MKFTLSEVKKYLQGTNSEGKEARIQINVLEHKGGINIQPEQNEETRIQKKRNKGKIRRRWDISKSTISETQGCQKEKKRSKKLKTYLKK